MTDTDTAFTEEFANSLSFGLDPFQLEACRFLEQGKTVLVSAPTGAGNIGWVYLETR